MIRNDQDLTRGVRNSVDPALDEWKLHQSADAASHTNRVAVIARGAIEHNPDISVAHSRH